MTAQRNVLGSSVLPVEQDTDSAAPGDSLFNLTNILQMVRVRQRIIIGTTVAVFALTAIVVFHMTPLYDASAEVLLDQRENKVVDVNAILSGLPTDPTSIENQLHILRSRNLMSHVIDKLHLEQEAQKPTPLSFVSDVIAAVNPLRWFGGTVTAGDNQDADRKRRNALIDGLLDSETVSELGLSSALKITYRSSAPEKSADYANAIADAYVEDQLNAKFEATQKTSQWLADRIQQLSAQMQSADAAVQEYKAENNITETAAGSIVDQQLAQLNGQLIIAKSDLAEAQSKYSRVRDLQASGRAEDVAQVFQSGMIEQLRQQQSDLLREQAQLATTFGPRHPKMLDIQSQLRNIDSKIDQEVKRVVETVSNDVAVASAHVGSLESSLAQIESQSTVQNKAKVKLTELQAKSASAHQLYEAFLGKFKETEGQEGIQTPDARIISKAEPPDSPVVPNILRSLETGGVAGLVLGLILAFLAERLDSGFRTTSQIEQMLGVPVLSTLPEITDMANSDEQAADRVIDKPLSSFAEALRGLQMGLALSNIDRKPQVVLVTSSVPDEGKTTVALALARTLARTGKKVVLLDGDLRRPSVGKAMNVEAGKTGLIEALSGDASLDSCLIKDPRSNVMFLPTSRARGNPPDVLASDAMEKLIATLKQSCDMVVIDSAPLLPVNDTKVLARLADTVLFVVRWEKTPRNAVASAGRALADVHAPVSGVVMTRADPTRYRYYSYGYQSYSTYSKYYND